MAWENRGDRRYYYRRCKVHGRVVAEYYGAGNLGELAASHAQLDRLCAEAARDSLRLRRKKEAATDRQFADYRHQVQAVVGAVLTAYGYHRHHRGEWRKKRDVVDKTQLLKVEMSDLSVLAAAVHRVQLTALGGVSEKVQDSILRDVANVRANLGWQSAPAHERLLIEHIGLCWLQLQLIEQFYAQNTSGTNYNQRTAEHMERRLSLAHHRYLQAVETLARIRKLNLTIQVNVAHQQIVTG